ncbi:uncharacterized protein LOC129601158 [Paramacrobiotus metropolitanus]|uniref:uncharacterized protein LOC129601158 n=1 Tax=Paramacrobiotus metropolitanus TaxID=2943436 RepID=UPI00244655C9|nr:uncharacterized protein LOC129601158 [Paramacrobiotus metropolitanus]
MSSNVRFAYNPIYDDPTLTMNSPNETQQHSYSDADTIPIIQKSVEIPEMAPIVQEKSDQRKLRWIRCVIIFVVFLLMMILLCILGIFLFIYHHRLTEIEMRNALPTTTEFPVTTPTNTLVDLTGEIIDADTTDPIHNATISALYFLTLNTAIQAVSNIDGEFDFPLNVTTKYILLFEHPAYRPVEIPHYHIKAADVDPEPLRIRMISQSKEFLANGPGVVQGSVLDANTSQPLANATVIFRNGLRNEHGGVVATLSTTANGTWEIRLPTGHYTVCLEKAGYKPECLAVVALANRTRTYPHQLSYMYRVLTVQFLLEWRNISRTVLTGTAEGSGVTVVNQTQSCLATSCRSTLTVSKLSPGPFSYAVRRTEASSSALDAGGFDASVTVYIKGVVRGHYRAPQRNGAVWDVVVIDGAGGKRLTEINTVHN